MASLRYRELERELKRLKRELLPKVFHPLGEYPKRVQTLTRAYLILAHAAVEHYLEQEAKLLARRAEELWTAKQRVTRPFAYLVSAMGVPLANPEASGRRSPEKLLSESAESAFRAYYKSIADNHGVKEQNVVMLFGRLGVPSKSFEGLLLPELDSFGEARGKQAHHAASVVTFIDPKTEHERVNRLLSELASFDKNLRAYEKAVFQ